MTARTFFRTQRRDGRLALELEGRWDVDALADIERALGRLELSGIERLELRCGALDRLGLSGAWLIRRLAERLRADGCDVALVDFPEAHRRLLDELELPEPPAAPARRSLPLRQLERLGRRSSAMAVDFIVALDFLGRICTTLMRASVSLRRLRLPAVFHHAYRTGVTAMPIVALIAFLISVVLAYMGSQQLRQFGAEIFTVDLVAIAVLREMGVLLTAIMVAGRSGSAFAAELGVMKLNEEIDALQAMGLDPFEVLVVPRILALVIAMPVLTVLADAFGLAGGALLSLGLLDISLAQFTIRLQEALAPTTFWVGIIKAPVFAFVIGFVGALRGMQVSGSSQELGRLTTVAVVQAIFLVILADALFAVLFQQLGI